MATTLATDRVREDLSAIEQLAGAPVATADALNKNLRTIYRRVFDIDLSGYDLAALRQQAPEVMGRLFELRVWLRDQIATWQQAGLMTPDVQAALRDVFRASRYAGDMLGEIAIGHERLGEAGTTYRAFTGAAINTYVHPNLGASAKAGTFRSGDVLLMRGMLHNSAAIARIGDVDSQFSHIAVVHVGADGTPVVVESLIEEGAIINSIEHVLDHGLGRCMHFRFKDAALAQAAAAQAHDIVSRARSGAAPHIPYDFTMELDGYHTLFCSKLVRMAYDAASAGAIKLPTYPTTMTMKNRDFVGRIGVTAKKTFAPGDIELEPAFDLVAEWQDYRATPGIRMQDMIMTKLFAWMDDHGYRFKEDFAIRLISLLGRASSHLSDRAKNMIVSVVPKVPDNMSRSAIAAIAMLHKTAEPLLVDLKVSEASRVAATGQPMHPRDIMGELERVRARAGRRIGYLVA